MLLQVLILQFAQLCRGGWRNTCSKNLDICETQHLRFWPYGRQVSFPHPPVIWQVILSSVSWSEVHCFYALWNDTLLQSFNTVHTSIFMFLQMFHILIICNSYLLGTKDTFYTDIGFWGSWRLSESHLIPNMGEEHRLRVLEWRVTRNIFGPEE
jgi:hypothetical protein